MLRNIFNLGNGNEFRMAGETLQFNSKPLLNYLELKEDNALFCSRLEKSNKMQRLDYKKIEPCSTYFCENNTTFSRGIYIHQDSCTHHYEF